MTKKEAIKVLRTESIELGGPASSVCRFWEALDMAIAALRQQDEPKPLSAFLAPMNCYKGLKRKFLVFKSDSGEMVENCFVLRPDKDPAAVSALRAYADATDNKVLSADIINWVGAERNEPLTLDELRKMPIRDWVWIEVLNPDAFRSKETVSAYYRKYDGYKKDEIFWCGYPGLGFGFDYADYGNTWLAYRQKPEDEDKHETM